MKIKNLDETEEIASGQTVLRDMFQRLATVRLMFHCSHRSNVCVFSFSHPLFGRITGVGPYLGTRACACPIAFRFSFTPEPRHLSINQTDGFVLFFFRRLGQDMCVSSSPWHPTAGSQHLYRKMRSFHGSLTSYEFSLFLYHQRRKRESFDKGFSFLF